ENSMFEQNSFQVCLCILAINFLNDLNQLALEFSQILQPGGVFYCCVPVPERNKTGSLVRGNLYSEKELQEIFSKHNFVFEASTATNGSILYFQAIKKVCSVISM
ncbi:MAG: methyltransferase domain-containing protein, partial [Candidatus Stygibacter frigidus]|nr:methyltransferase domain-containing protein [Candidatus Stygibacter frigidus]